MRKAILLCSIMIFILSAEAYSQSWLWGKRGGSETQSGNGSWETVNDITTDNNGNVYALCRVDLPGMDIDGHPLTGYGDYDIIITSFSCDGTYRWSKVIGSNDHQDVGVAIKTDEFGGVYVCGELYMPTDNYVGHIDTDSTISLSRKSLFIVKYDADGNYQWLQMPQSDSVTSYSYQLSKYFDMDVDQWGNTRVLALLAPGTYHNGNYIVQQTGVHMMQYNPNGDFILGEAFDIGISQIPTRIPRMVRNQSTGNYYIAGSRPGSGGDTIAIGGSVIKGNGYVAAFDPNGNHLWTTEGDSSVTQSGFDGRPVLDEAGNIYVAGRTFNGEQFAGHQTVNTIPNNLANIPFIVKLESENGNLVWARNSSGKSGRGMAVTIRNANEVVLAGMYDGKMDWAGYNGTEGMHADNNQADDVFLCYLNSNTGDVLLVDTLGSDFGSRDFANCITTDKYNNVIVGGRFENEMYVGEMDTLVMKGETADMFLAKHGVNTCSTLGLGAAQLKNELMIYPNPTFNTITVMSTETIKSVEVMSAVGQIVIMKSYHSDKASLDVSGLSNGIYFIRINGTQMEKFVKE